MKIMAANLHSRYVMRSYSEVVWARIMDALDIQWLYEAVTVETRHGLYLPDFLLPQAGIAVEVKGACATQTEIDKARDASIAMGRPVAIAWGTPDSSGGITVAGGSILLIYHEAAISYSTAELTQAIWAHGEHKLWARLMCAARREKFNPVRNINHVLNEALFSTVLGDEAEPMRRAISAELNAEKQTRQASAAEKAINLLASAVIERVGYHHSRRATA